MGSWRINAMCPDQVLAAASCRLSCHDFATASIIARSTDPTFGPLIALRILLLELYAMQVDPRYTTVVDGPFRTLPEAEVCAYNVKVYFEEYALGRRDRDRLLMGWRT